MITSQHVREVRSFISSLPVDKKLIIGIEGYSGMGKSTLLEILVEEDASMLGVHRDDFLIPRLEFSVLMKNSGDKGKTLAYEAVDVQLITEFAAAFRSSEGIHTYTLRADHSAKNTTGENSVVCAFDFSKRILILEGVWVFHPKLFDSIFDYRIVLEGDWEVADERRRQREKQKWGEKYMSDEHPDSYF